MPYASSLNRDPDAALPIEQAFASLGALSIGDHNRVTHDGPCLTILVVAEVVHSGDLVGTPPGLTNQPPRSGSPQAVLPLAWHDG